jgi:magnesium transporter
VARPEDEGGLEADVEAAPSSRHSVELHSVPVEEPCDAPGTLRLDETVVPRIMMIDYGEHEVVERELKSIDECVPFLESNNTTWIDIQGIGQSKLFESLGKIFRIHPLALEDCVNVPQRPKSDVYPEQQVLITRMASLSEGDLVTEQLAILFGKGFVVTVQEEPNIDCLDPLRYRIRKARGSIRTAGADYLAYAIFDAVIDGFYPVLEHFGESLDELEMNVAEHGTSNSTEIFELKRELLALRRAVWPQRELLASLLRDDSPHITADTRVYFRDTYDHSVQVMDMVETFREIASSLMDLQMTMVSNRLNEVMKVLTILSTIFLPMTFVAGVYGMNFSTEKSPFNMPELNWHLGYPFSILLMIGSAGSLLYYYYRKGWIGQRRPPVRRLKKRKKRAHPS